MSGQATAYDRLIQLLEVNSVSYRLIEHEPEGRTEVVSSMRGNPLAAAAKCMIVMVKTGKKQKSYVLAVVPGDRRVDLDALKSMKVASYAGFVAPNVAEDLSGCLVGTVLPVVFDERLELIVDPRIFDHDEIYFNAARLDRSIAMSSADYRRITKPTEALISG